MEKQGKGAIINVSSIASIRMPKGIHYVAIMPPRARQQLHPGGGAAIRPCRHSLQRHPARADEHAMIAVVFGLFGGDYEKMIAMRDKISPTGKMGDAWMSPTPPCSWLR